ncbi:MAG TPA: shikimate kinase [Abditibacteriaceae bacterium]|jgi:shikimate kinase
MSTASTRKAPVVLIGFMGSGKSSVARELAQILGCETVDTDAEIERQSGQSIREMFQVAGEDAFRQLESAALRAALRGTKTLVVSTGGGIVKSAANREVLYAAMRAGVTVVYLRAGAQTLARRIRLQPGVRPLIDGERVLDEAETQQRVAALLAERGALYEACASCIIDTDEHSAREIAQRIAGQEEE